MSPDDLAVEAELPAAGACSYGMLIHVTAPISSHTFLTPPTFRVALAKRDRVLALLRAGADCRVTLIEAPAGYGKTWLLARCHAELRASGSHVVWLGIEEADPAQFVSILAAGLARAGLDLGGLSGRSLESLDLGPEFV